MLCDIRTPAVEEMIPPAHPLFEKLRSAFLLLSAPLQGTFHAGFRQERGEQIRGLESFRHEDQEVFRRRDVLRLAEGPVYSRKSSQGAGRLMKYYIAAGGGKEGGRGDQHERFDRCMA